MQLEPADRGKLVHAIAASFTSLDLELLMMSRSATDLRNIASAQLPDIHQAMKLVQYFEMRNEVEQLVAAVRDARPSVAAFVDLAEKVGLVQPPDATSLQALMKPGRPGDAGRDPTAFRTGLSQREDTICRIVVGGKRYGTGTLLLTLEFLAVAAGTIGVAALVRGSIILVRETAIAVRVISERAASVRARARLQ